MATRNSFQQELADVGVPNKLVNPVTDESMKTAVEGFGSMAIEANRGYEDARLENRLEGLIDQAVNTPGNDTRTYVNFGNEGALAKPYEMPTNAEIEAERKGNSLRTAYESGQITYNELQARMQSEVRSQIDRMPGRADTFRNIYSKTLGDHEARLAPLKLQQDMNDAYQKKITNAYADLHAKSIETGIPIDQLVELNGWKARREYDQSMQQGNSQAYTSNLLDTNTMGVEERIRQLVVANGNNTLGEQDLLLLRDDVRTRSNQMLSDVTATAQQQGWTEELKAQRDAITQWSKTQLDNINVLSQTDYLSNMATAQENMIKYNLHTELGPMLWLARTLPAEYKVFWEAAAMRQQIQKEPNAQRRAEMEAKFRQRFPTAQGPLAEAFSTMLNTSGPEAGIAVGRELEKIKANYNTSQPTPMSKETATVVGDTEIVTEEDKQINVQALETLFNSEDGNGMSLKALMRPKWREKVSYNKELQEMLKVRVMNELASLVHNYEMDARTVNDYGAVSRMPFGPAYSMEFANGLVPNSPQFRVPGNPLFRGSDVDKNYREGIKLIGEAIDAYPYLFDNVDAQSWIAERISNILATREGPWQEAEQDNTNASVFNREPMSNVQSRTGQEVYGTSGTEVKDAFLYLKNALFGPGGLFSNTARVESDRVTEEDLSVAMQEPTPTPSPSAESAVEAATEAPTFDSAPVLDLIGRVEANGNYNAYFGNASNTKVDFSTMTVDEVLDWQDQYVSQGSPSSAVGKYQFIRKTLKELKNRLNLSGNEKFTPELQDQMAEYLMNRRGLEDYRAGKITAEEFANNLAKEWASLPVVSGEKRGSSYYGGDGLNKALISPDEILKALQ